MPYVPDCSAPGDRRRFCRWAKRRGVPFQIADPAKRYDVVVVSEAADLTVWRRYAPGAKLVYDLIDSYLAIPRSDVKALLRGTAKFLARRFRYPAFDYWRAVRRMCRRADAVVCTTEEQRAAILPDCPNVHIVLDIQDGDVRTVKQDYTAGQPFALVWEGLPVNLGSLRVVAGALRKLHARHDLILHVVTDPSFYAYLGRLWRRESLTLARRILGDLVEFHPWSAETVSRVAAASDLAIVPIPLHDPLARGKPENKLLFFWRLGAPTVASATPAYVRTMKACGVALTCSSEAEWMNTLERCILDEGLRRSAAAAGQAYAVREQGEDRILERWDAVFASLFPVRTSA